MMGNEDYGKSSSDPERMARYYESTNHEVDVIQRSQCSEASHGAATRTYHHHHQQLILPFSPHPEGIDATTVPQSQ